MLFADPASVWEAVTAPFRFPFVAHERIYWLFLLSSLVAALLVYVRRKQPEEGFSLKRLLAFCFPKSVFLHRSARQDYVYFWLNTVLFGGVMLGYSTAILLAVSGTVEHLLSPVDGLLGESNPWVVAAYTLLTAVAMDFGIFIAHWYQHKARWAWEFHKVHHTAEVLTPITVYRMHPVDDLMTIGASSAMLGLTDGLFQGVFATQVGLLPVAGLNLVFYLFYLFGYNLRHSHIWVDYGPKWDQVFVSPAQHQIHHSAEERHWDKNMGFIFAFWDKLFGTLYVPKGQETFRMGIDDAAEQERFREGIWTWYLHPFERVWGMLAPANQPFHPRRIATVAALGLAISVGFWLPKSESVEKAPPLVTPTESVMLQDLTWDEVRDRLAQGTDRVIVPTGGTEQNGPHVILGKHNYIVQRNAEAIARQLGRTLVAPVMAYVPEGNPGEGHMRFAGTLSIPEPLFADTLEATARSLKYHGFKAILLVGDSGGNQAMQAQVAEKLNAEWRAEGVQVIHVGDYYFRNGQTDWLTLQGETMDAIGTHAGIRDTSELMAVQPAGVRLEKRAYSTAAQEPQTGVIGDPRRASAAYGQALLDLKVKAAVAQIRRELREPPRRRVATLSK